MTDITQLLKEIEGGNSHSADALLQLTYDELRKLAAYRLAQEKPGHTLQATALVHEAYLRLIGPENSNGTAQAWNGSGHFFSAAAEAMRRILIESARRKHSRKRGGGQHVVSLNNIEVSEAPGGLPLDDLLALDEALERLATLDARKAKLVKLRLYAGLSVAEAAQVLGISRATAVRHWDFSRSWLFAELQDPPRTDREATAYDIG